MADPYYQDESITLYCGDCMALIEELPRADALICDPPYGETSLDWDRWPDGWPKYAAKLSNQLWCFGSMRMFLSHSPEFSDWKFAQDIIWQKQNGSGFAADRFRRVHESVCHFYRGAWEVSYHETQYTIGGTRLYKVQGTNRLKHTNKIESYVYESNGKRIVESVIFTENCNGYATNETQKPEAILAPLINYSVPVGGLVIDLFAGSGTTLAVAKKLGRKAIGVEMRESQCEDIARRFSQRDLFSG